MKQKNSPKFLPALLGMLNVCRQKIFWLLILLSTVFSLPAFSQFSLAENMYKHFEGIAGPKNYLVLDLHKFSDSIFGTYYYRKDGILHYFYGKMNSQVGFVVVEKNGDSLIGEFISLHKIKGYLSGRKNNLKSSFLFSETDYFGSMAFECFNNKRTYDYADKPLFPRFTVDLKLLYPEGHPNRSVQDSVQDYILGYYFGKYVLFNPRDKMLGFLSSYNYQNYTAHYKTNAFEYRSPLLVWSAVQNVQVLFNENFVLTFCIEQNTSNWNKDPMWDKFYFVFNLKTGQRITYADVFIPGFQEKLKSLLTIRLQKQFNIVKSLQSEGFFKSSVTRFDNIYVTREGIGFHYNPGDLAPVIFGEIDLFFKFDELKEILLAKGLVYTLVQ